MTLRRTLSTEDQAAIEALRQREQTAQQLREGVERFRATFSLSALAGKSPFVFPSADPTPLSFRALSWYRYPGWAALAEVHDLKVLNPFYVALLLVDFTPMRAELVTQTEISLDAAGQTPYDPVSLFLCCLLRWHKGLGWEELYKRIAGPEGGCWRQLFGFTEGHIPAPSTMRAFYKALDSRFDLDLCPRFISLLQAAGLLPAHTTHPTTPAQRGLPDCADGMLHEAHSSMRCSQVRETCYQPTSAQQPRPCPAKDKGLEGCDCREAACTARCRFTTPRDPQARLIHYAGTNQEGEENPRRARDVYGYLSYPQVLRDDELHVSWVAYTTLHPANTAERTILPDDFAHLTQRLPELLVGELVADSAVGYADCLDPLYEAGVIPVVVIRHDPTDKEEDACRLRGYDEHGHPLCAHGYPMSFNGIDYQRLRACWVCRQVCQQQSPPQPEDVDCPFGDPNHPLGMVTHVGRAFTHPDGTRHARLARLYPYGSELWKAHYGPRKNAVEGRNSQLAALGLKRIWSYGLEGATADVTFADLVVNLRTLGRLVQQATLLEG